MEQEDKSKVQPGLNIDKVRDLLGNMQFSNKSFDKALSELEIESKDKVRSKVTAKKDG